METSHRGQENSSTNERICELLVHTLYITIVFDIYRRSMRKSLSLLSCRLPVSLCWESSDWSGNLRGPDLIIAMSSVSTLTIVSSIRRIALQKFSSFSERACALRACLVFPVPAPRPERDLDSAYSAHIMSDSPKERIPDEDDTLEAPLTMAASVVLTNLPRDASKALETAGNLKVEKSMWCPSILPHFCIPRLNIQSSSNLASHLIF